MAFFSWRGPSGKVKSGNSTHFVELLGKPHTSDLYNKLAKKPKKDMSKVVGQAFIKGRKIPPTWKKIHQIF